VTNHRQLEPNGAGAKGLELTAAHLPLDRQAIATLEQLGFTVGDEKAAARIGDATVTIKRVGDLRLPEFEVEIVLPSGAVLRTFTRRRLLLDAGKGAR
jgi:hypothetical protein